MIEKNKHYIIKITDISSDGNGVGEINGFTVFVPMTAIGDVVDVIIVKVLSHYAIGRAMEIKEASHDRIEATCPSFRRCGGCQLQHIKYDVQLNIKKKFITDAMRRIGGFEGFECDDIIGMETPFRYRNKCIFPIGTDKNNNPISGFYARRSHDIIPIDDCIAGDEINTSITRAVLDYMGENNIEAYNEASHTGLIRRIFIRTGNCEIMVVLSVNGKSIPNAEQLIKKLRSVSDKITSVYININTAKTNNVLGQENNLIYGKKDITGTICGIAFKISPHSFYQINSQMTEKLYKRALEYADICPDDNVLDVYCGIGTITLLAAKTAKKVIGIEIVKQAVEDAKKNACANDINNAEFFAESAEKAVPLLINKGLKPDIVILDPPRKGSDEVTLNAIVSANPKKIVYVSCNPSTLARDAKYLSEKGYIPRRCTAVDMFPHTCHVETVCLLSKLKSSEHIEVELNMDELDLTAAEKKATYQEIKDYVLEHYGLKVSHLNIAQVKRKCGIIERENYNKPKSVNAKQPNCTPEKEKAIMGALRHFGMI